MHAKVAAGGRQRGIPVEAAKGLRFRWGVGSTADSDSDRRRERSAVYAAAIISFLRDEKEMPACFELFQSITWNTRGQDLINNLDKYLFCSYDKAPKLASERAIK
eukprot:IDg15952t1